MTSHDYDHIDYNAWFRITTQSGPSLTIIEKSPNDGNILTTSTNYSIQPNNKPSTLNPILELTTFKTLQTSDVNINLNLSLINASMLSIKGKIFEEWISSDSKIFKD